MLKNMAVTCGINDKRSYYVGVKKNQKFSMALDNEEDFVNNDGEVRRTNAKPKSVRKICHSVGNKKKKSNSNTKKFSSYGEKTWQTKELSKNALNARLSREKKKKYVLSLETQNIALKEENIELKKKRELQDQVITQLKHEVCYLKSTLANSKELCQLIEGLKLAGLNVTSNLVSPCDSNDEHKAETNIDLIKYDQKSKLDQVVSHSPKTKHLNFPIVNNDINLGSKANNVLMLEKENFSSSNFLTNIYDNDHSPDNFFSNNNGELNVPNSEGGVCLHVNHKMISLEFCYLCNASSPLSMFSPINLY